MAELRRDEILRSLEKLEELSKEEYAAPFLEVMNDPTRVRRLGGVMIKQPFAYCSGKNPKSATGALRSWTWDDTLIRSPDKELPEFQLLDSLRDWRGLGPAPGGFEVLIDQADNERGLFKVTALWLQDRLRGRETRSLREYYGAAESRKFATLLDLADFLANFALTPVYAAVLPAGAWPLGPRTGECMQIPSPGAPTRDPLSCHMGRSTTARSG